MKRINLLAIILTAFFALFTLSATKLYADTVKMNFTGVGPGHNSGGVYTYPYEFTVTPAVGASLNLSLMCISFDKEITIPETWKADVYTAGQMTTTIPGSAGNAALYEKGAYLYSMAAANPSNGAANWAAWALFKYASDSPVNQLSDEKAFLQSHIGSGQEYTDAYNLLNGLSSITLADYANYKVFLAEPGTQSSPGTAQDFIGVTPEPSSLLLIGTGLLGFAIFLYYKRHNAVGSF